MESESASDSSGVAEVTGEILLVDPAVCRLWSKHNRVYEALSVSRCADLIAALRAAGRQLTPAIVRPLEEPSDGVLYEVVCGARRLWSVRHLRERDAGYRELGYLVDVRHQLSDAEAFCLSDFENRVHQDISAYERGLDYREALGSYYEGSVGELAAGLGGGAQDGESVCRDCAARCADPGCFPLSLRYLDLHVP